MPPPPCLGLTFLSMLECVAMVWSFFTDFALSPSHTSSMVIEALGPLPVYKYGGGGGGGLGRQPHYSHTTYLQAGLPHLHKVSQSDLVCGCHGCHDFHCSVHSPLGSAVCWE